jgi:NADH:ubiquinone oxidoreductase subunit E
MTALRKIVVCVNHRANPDQPSCGARGGEAIACTLEQALKDHGLAIPVERFNCLGRCEVGPNMRLVPAGPFYQRLNIADIPALMVDIEKFYKS